MLRVTTLDADGPGSLRRALEDDRPRLVVFEVGGVIDLGGDSLLVRNPHLTIAGQTAPDPGITIIRGGLTIETYDVVVAHISVRLGDAGGADDSLGARRAHDVLFDHCSATWAVDENLSVSGPADVDSSRDPEATSHDVTLRSCLIAEGLMHANHPKGAHSMGTLIHDGVRGVVIEGCLFAHNNERNPRLKGGSTAQVIGNVMYNWGSACVGVGRRGNRRILQPAEATLIGNVAIPGPDTRDRALVKNVDPGARVTLRDNVVVGDTTPHPPSGHLLPAWRGEGSRGPSPRAAGRGWSRGAGPGEGSAAATILRVLRSAGSRPAHRDPIDTRIVRSVIDGTGRIIDSQDQVGGYPIRPRTQRALVVPDGAEERRRWLNNLSDALNVAPSPDWQR
ncbi:MAG TPA: hypothetical protein VER58_19385 [Thermoanaerobaculia bacterium]|nr:hypothetical protein [Thermoanaerobaculia bacterium]